ncbi:integrase core domain protein [Leptotrichia wadei]|uniref:Integrase core domain protein n=1 Tax=Leptotrichia wadei TaxID=157687 RepID=A0A510KQ17_9FUSO|nr:helix-turn-helix domain-containing protein [Leptotrichia wadei]BBM53820.1 integrase core domain protein [Leptotrichia wadei]
MNSISEEYCVRQRAVEYAIKHNNNSKAALKYKTSRQQIKRWRDRYDGTVQSLMPKSRRPKSHPNQHTQEEIDLIMKNTGDFHMKDWHRYIPKLENWDTAVLMELCAK